MSRDRQDAATLPHNSDESDDASGPTRRPLDYETPQAPDRPGRDSPDAAGWGSVGRQILLYGIVEPALFILVLWMLFRLLW